MKREAEFKVIVPKYDNEGHRIGTEVLSEIAAEMSEHFGGVTVIPTVLGCWKDEEGKLVCEENALFISARDLDSVKDPDKILSEDRVFMRRLAEKVGKKLGQEYVFVEEDVIQDVSFVAGMRKPSVPPALREKDWFKKLID